MEAVREIRKAVAVIDREFMGTEEAGAMIGVKRQRINQMVREGDLEAFRFGRKMLVSRSQMEKLAKQRRNGHGKD